ncbi:hypothetical protein WICPIJ_001275 [Wickerhamomyces pijperi]|uniref:Uncharacterized protein n=1 Tax=Wickerhamomyces pijperi TaxID=599730 RepID=A0A9P8QC25_WICPI|nr:hypothetical protein WICPIJ_001275 [Wickerhamomyces pijperi]
MLSIEVFVSVSPVLGESFCTNCGSRIGISCLWYGCLPLMASAADDDDCGPFQRASLSSMCSTNGSDSGDILADCLCSVIDATGSGFIASSLKDMFKAGVLSLFEFSLCTSLLVGLVLRDLILEEMAAEFGLSPMDLDNLTVAGFSVKSEVSGSKDMGVSLCI